MIILIQKSFLSNMWKSVQKVVTFPKPSLLLKKKSLVIMNGNTIINKRYDNLVVWSDDSKLWVSDSNFLSAQTFRENLDLDNPHQLETACKLLDKMGIDETIIKSLNKDS